MSEPPARHLHRARTRVDVPVVEVRPGDTLWGIAADLLGPTASDRDIAHQWPQWYRENRAVVGPDPDRLVPGQHLHPPELP
ncbi:MAG: LysM peptidoglycan-binding domain-containing protein [Propionibacteriales bacterium]|nr:LysM peptidoglycan-binding domain-containing protein [Propionibacteriales bacterium]